MVSSSPTDPFPRDPGPSPDDGPRLTLLLSAPVWREGTLVDHLPRLLTPLGIQSIKVDSGEEAAAVIEQRTIHIAVVDLEMPLRPDQPATARGGARILQLLRRLDQPPPTVVVRPPQPKVRENVRSLVEALREGAFAVLDRPLELESMLEVMRRILARHYEDLWPT